MTTTDGFMQAPGIMAGERLVERSRSFPQDSPI
jgi:hypothetical protein